MRKALCVVLIFQACFLIQCANNLAGGTSSSENGIVAGCITGPDGVVQPGILVLLIPLRYNPHNDQNGDALLTDTTNGQGEFRIEGIRKGIYNIQASDLSEKSLGLFIPEITIKDNTVLALPADTLQANGALRVFVSDTVDREYGYIYVEGSTIVRDLKDGTFYTGNMYEVVLDSVPAGKLPQVILASAKTSNSSTSTLLAGSVTITSINTTIIGTDSIGKPIWRFPVIVGATSQTVQHYKGMDSLEAKVRRQIASINDYFNDPDVFDGFIDLSVDSIYEFSTSVEEEVKKSINNFALRIIYDQFGLDYLAYWYSSNRVLYIPMNVNNGDDLFTDRQNKNMTWGVGLFRGCLAQEFIRVSSVNNKINGEPFFGLKSIMNSPTVYQDWDDFSIHIVNYYKNNYSTHPDIIKSAFPSSMGVVTQTNAGEPVGGVKIDLFGVKLVSYAVTDTPIVSGVTDSSGDYRFKSNPYKLGNIITDEIKYGNFLVRGIHSADTVYAWMPITEVGNAWFDDPGANYRTRLVFPDKKEGYK